MNILKGTITSASRPEEDSPGVFRVRATLMADGRERHLIIAWSDGCQGFEHLKRGNYLEVHTESGQPREIERYIKIAEREIVIDGQTVTVEQDSLF